MKNVISYWRNSLADSDRLNLNISKLGFKHEITWSEVETGKLSKEIVESYFGMKKFKNEDIVNILFCPVIAYPTRQHGVEKVNLSKSLVPLWVPACLDKEGNLSVDLESFPWIPRNYLEPSANESIIIGSVEILDDFLSKNPMPTEKWSDFWEYVMKMFNVVTGQNLKDFEYEDYSTSETGWVFINNNIQGASSSIIRLYNHILKNGISYPLLKKYASLEDTESTPCLDFVEEIEKSAEHIGQMSNVYPVSISQRETIHHFFSLDDGEILAVNGPPGTGKTTLLQSIIASMWVEAAYKNSRPPIIVASSANNQPVTNVIESFGNLDEKPNSLEGRWLPDIHSYGLYLSSKSATKKPNVQTLFKGIPDQGFPDEIEDEEYLTRAEVFFLDKCKSYASSDFKSVQDAVSFLHKKLIKTVDQIKDAIKVKLQYLIISEEHKQKYPDGLENIIINIDSEIRELNEEISKLDETENKLEIEWVQHLHDEPWWYSFFSFLSFVKRKKKLRDKLFFLSKKIDAKDEESFKKYFKILRDATKEKLTEKVRQLKVFKEDLRQYNEVTKLLDSYFDLMRLDKEKSLLEQLDYTYRYKAFKLATHYWEGKWLMEMRVNFSSKIRESHESKWLRYAKLTPCFVSTLFMIPSFFGARGGNEPLYNFIDLLIIDEAGQVRPEVAGASFALAKKALIVGDTLQIEPIWELPKTIDLANIIKFNLASSSDDAEEKIISKGINASSGSVMMIGQGASKYQKFDDVKGMYLTEHRRCVPEIIEYCNEIAYKGRLEPKRESIQDFPLPHIGYIHIEGKMIKDKGSNSNYKESEIIAEWISENQDMLEDLYPSTKIENIVAVITPFVQQKNLIKRELKKKKLGDITVGTVHSLQGAERPIVIFSPVYDIGAKTSQYFFDRGINMLNVAVSRAKDSFLVFGDMRIFNINSSSPSGVLAKYLFSDVSNEIKISETIK